MLGLRLTKEQSTSGLQFGLVRMKGFFAQTARLLLVRGHMGN